MEDNEEGWLKCNECTAVFSVIWHLDPAINGVEFCPFCGSEIEPRVDGIPFQGSDEDWERYEKNEKESIKVKELPLRRKLGLEVENA